MKTKFNSQYFTTIQELVEGKDNALSAHRTRKKRLKTIRQFSNGLATMTKKEAESLGRKEITNHLTSYSKLSQNESQIHSMATGTNNLVEVIVKTGEPEHDQLMGQRLSQVLNEGAFNYEGAFASFWKQVAGETVISGGAPCTWESKYGWLPEVSTDIFFPRGTSLRPKRVPFAFAPEEYTLADLNEMMATLEGRSKGRVFEKENIEYLIKALKEQVRTNTKTGEDFDPEVKTQSVRKEGQEMKTDTIGAWSFFEVKTDDEGNRYVSKTIFVDDIQAGSHSDYREGATGLKDGADDGAAKVIAYVEKAFDDPRQWLWNVSIDSEIGGKKTTDEQRGVAEILYPSTAEMEDLLNLLLDGDKMRARPKVKITSAANADDVAQWDIETDTHVPDGVEEMQFGANSQHLQTPISMLDQNAASIAGSPISNSGRGGELRQQAVERQDVSSNVQANRISEAFTHMEAIVEVSVWRLLAGPVKKGVDGYEEAMWVRERLNELGIDPAKIAERSFGRFKHLRIRVKRSIGNGDRQQQVATADKVMANIQHIEPATRPIVIQRAFALWTQDPDLAEAIVRPPQVILNQQRIEAENEFTTVTHRAKMGYLISPQPENIHHLHIQTHLLDMQAHVAGHELRPWDLLDTVAFAAMVEHTGEHLKILLGNPATNFEGNQFLQAYQQVVAQAKPAVASVQQAQDEGGQLTEKERADIEIAIARLQLDAEKFGLQAADLADLARIRESRATLSNRQQYVREINDDRRITLEEQKRLDAKKESAKTSDK